MADCFVSIVVPVFNAERDILSCLRSIANQDYSNFEVLVIDDGSSDGSALICDAFAVDDIRFSIFHQQNCGVSAARNSGIQKARGKYIAFVDSDDIMLPGFLSSAVQKMEENQTEYLCGAFRLMKDNQLGVEIDYLNNKEDIISIDTYLTCMCDYHTEAFWGANWAKLYRRDMILQHNIRFESGVQLAEDFRFNLTYLTYVKKVSLLHEAVYAYRIDTGNSLSKKARDPHRYWNEYYELYLRYCKAFASHGLQDRFQVEISEFLIRACYAVLRDGMAYSLGNLPAMHKLMQEMIKTQDVQNALLKKNQMRLTNRRICGGIRKGNLYLIWLYALNKRIQMKLMLRK